MSCFRERYNSLPRGILVASRSRSWLLGHCAIICLLGENHGGPMIERGITAPRVIQPSINRRIRAGPPPASGSAAGQGASTGASQRIFRRARCRRHPDAAQRRPDPPASLAIAVAGAERGAVLVILVPDRLGDLQGFIHDVRSASFSSSCQASPSTTPMGQQLIELLAPPLSAPVFSWARDAATLSLGSKQEWNSVAFSSRSLVS